MPLITKKTVLVASCITFLIMAISVGITASAQGYTRAPLDGFAVAISAGIPFVTAFPSLLWLVGLQERLRSANADLAAANAALDRLATTDSLTGMRMRDTFFNLMEEARISFSPGVLLMIDADLFKPINDRFGHASGDIVLQELSSAIRSSLRHGDVCGRVGGEEFAVYLPDTNPEAAWVIAERIRATVANREINVSECEVISVSVSIGMAFAYDDRNRGQLLAAADRQLYRAKEAGRNCVMVEGQAGLASVA